MWHTSTLNGCRVLNYAGETGALCLRMLADMGASIVLVDAENRPVHFLEQVKTADFFIESAPPGRLDELSFYHEKLAAVNPRLITASITPFGQTGQYKDFNASDLTLQALGGWLSVTGEPDNPLKLYGSQAYKTASLFAVNGLLLALRRRAETGRGQYIDISIMECVAATLDHVLVRYFYEGIVSGRQGARTWNNTFDILPCADGHILISVYRQWETLVELMAAEGLADDLNDSKYLDREERNRNIGHILDTMRRWTVKHKAAELEELGQLMHFPWAAVNHG